MAVTATSAGGPGLTWLAFALGTVACWGLYAVFLHTGQMAMGNRYKAFLFVGVAYFIVAVLAPSFMMMITGAEWTFTPKGMKWSLLAGFVGAIGAFFVLMAFGAGGTPSVVMSIVFAGAPIVNAFVAIAWHPPAEGLRGLRWPFVLGIALAAFGGCLVALYRPLPGKAPATPAHASVEDPTGDASPDN